MANIFIYGAGGHAKVIIDIIEQAGIEKIVGLVDDTGSTDSLINYPVFNDFSSLIEQGVTAGIVAIGDNWKRSKIVDKIVEKCKNFKFITAIHPTVNQAKDVFIGAGTVVMAGCTLNPCIKVGRHCIVNTHSSIDHDCTVNDFSSIAPGVTLGGNVTIGEFTAVGLGTSIIQKIEIGPHSVLGAGSIVIKNIPSDCVAYGNPCQFIRKRNLDEPYL